MHPIQGGGGEGESRNTPSLVTLRGPEITVGLKSHQVRTRFSTSPLEKESILRRGRSTYGSYAHGRSISLYLIKSY